MKREFQDQQMRLNELDLQFQRVSGEAACLQQENELLKQKLSQYMDYEFVKQENRTLKYKLDISKGLIGEKSVMMSGRSNRMTARSNANNNSQAMPPQSQANDQQRYVPVRKRSVTFASDNPMVPIINLNQNEKNSNLDNLEENSVMLATEMGADQDVLPQEPNNNIGLNEEENRTSYIEEGERILEEAVVQSLAQEKLDKEQLNDLKHMYEMQIFEQRKLHETVNDVKRQIEFLFTGTMLGEFDATKQGSLNAFGKQQPATKLSSLCDIDLINTSAGFIDSAKDRLKFLESESQRIDQTYQDYQHKIKSKYYPINDDDESEFQVIHKKKKDVNKQPLDIEKFLESTLRANMKAKVMREELEAEVAKQNTLHKSKFIEQQKIETLKSVESLIQSVSLPVVPGLPKIDTNLLKDQLVADENDFNVFKSRHRSVSPPKSPTVGKLNIKKGYLDDDSLTDYKADSNKSNSAKKNMNKLPDLDSKNSSTSESVSPGPVQTKRAESPPKKSVGFGIGDYVKMFDETKPASSGTSSPKKTTLKSESNDEESGIEKLNDSKFKTKHIKIEYSSSTSNSDDDDRKRVVNQQSKAQLEVGKSRDDDDDDDFKW
jgi:hypothetical protein